MFDDIILFKSISGGGGGWSEERGPSLPQYLDIVNPVFAVPPSATAARAP